MKKLVPSLLIPTFFILLTSQLVYAPATLTLTVSTYNPYYGRGETVTINGTLTWNDIGVGDGVVAIQVNKPDGDPMVVRASPTGSAEGDWSVEVLQVYSSDSSGRPRSNFTRNTNAYYTTVIRNNLNVDKNLALILSLFYPPSAPPLVPYKVIIPVLGIIPPGNMTITVSDPIPSDAVLGTYTVYANAFTELPSNNGYAYCPEKSANFNITSTLSLALDSGIKGQTVETASINGSYSLTFRLSSSATIGNYPVYASTYYQGQQSTATSTFEVRLLGDVNRDGMVEGKDLAIAAKAFGTSIGEPGYVPNADVNGDGMIEGRDIAIIAKHFGEY